MRDWSNREDLFWVRLEPKEDCLVWTGSIKSDGYGATNYQNKPITAHRLAYIYTYGEIPHGLVLDHLCRVRLCANPEHLEPVTNRENILRGFRDRGVCRNGHTRTPETTLTWRDKKTIGGFTNHCKTCRQLNQAKFKKAAGL